MKRDKYIPELRFDGFEEEWEQYRFSDFAWRVGHLKDDPTIPTVEFEDINSKRGTLNKDIFSKKTHKTGLLFEINDVLYGKLRPYLGNVFLSNFQGIAAGDFWILRANGVSPFYLYHFLLSRSFEKIANISRGSKMPRASWDNINLVKFAVPSIDESKNIALLLSTIDTLISKQELLINKQKTNKLSFLQILFPQGKETQPRLRLDGFSGEWEKHLFSEYAYCIKRKNKNISSQNILTISALHGLISQSEFYNKRIASYDLSGYYLIYQGEFAYNKSYSADYPWGAVKRLDKYTDGVVSNLYITFGLNNIDSDFVVCYFMSDLWHKEVSLCAKEGARNHGLLNISADDFFDISILIPKTIKEQKAIAKIIFEFDRLIQLNELKLEKLKNLKQSMLDKMFV